MKCWCIKFVHLSLSSLPSVEAWIEVCTHRIAGIINSINRDSSWRTVTFSQERTKIKEIIKSDFNYLIGLRDKLKRIVNK